MALSGEGQKETAQVTSHLLGMLSAAMEETCFKRCVRKPGVKLEKADEMCLSRCMDRYLESWGIVSEAFNRVSAKLAAESPPAENSSPSH